MIFSGNNFLSLSDQTGVSFLTEISLNNSSGICNLGLNYESISKFNFSLNNGKIYDPENRFVYSYEPNETFSISGEVSSGQYSYYINGTPIVLNKYKTGLPILITDYYLNTSNCIAEAKVDILGQKQNLNISLNDKFYDTDLLTGTILVDKNFNFKIISGSVSSNPTNFAIDYIPNKTGYFTIKTANLTQTESKKSYIVNLNLYTNFGKINRTFYTTGILSSDIISIFRILDDVYINPYFSGNAGELISNKYNLNYNITTGDLYNSARADKKLKIKFEYFGGFTGETTGQVPSSGILNNFLLTGNISGTGYISNYINAKLTGTAAFSIGAQNNTNQITGQKNIYIEQPFSINQNNLAQTIKFIGTGYLNTGTINDTNFIATGAFYNGTASGYIEKVGILTGTFNKIIGSGYYNNTIYSGLIETGFLYKNKYFTGNSIYNLNNEIGTGIATGFSTGIFFSTGYVSASVSGFITGSGFLSSNLISYNATGKLSGNLNNIIYVKNVSQKFLSPKVATGNFDFNIITTGTGIGTVLYFEDLSIQDSPTYNPNPTNWGLILLSNQKLTGYGNTLNNNTYSSLDVLNKNNYFKKIYSQISNIYAINDKDQLFTTGINNLIASGIAVPNNSILTSGVEKISISRVNWGMILYKNGLVSGFGDVAYSFLYNKPNNLTGVEDIFANANHGVALLNNKKITGWGGSSLQNSVFFNNKSYLTGINKIITNSSSTASYPCFVSLNNGKIETLYTPTSSTASGIRGVRYQGYFNDDPNFFKTGNAYTVSSSDDQITSNISGFGDPLNNYSWEWFGYFKPTTSENYTFYTNSDDGSYVWVGSNALTGYNTGNALVQNGSLHGPQERSGTVNLIANSLNPIRIQYGDAGGLTSMTFAFSTPTISKTTNCSGYFYYSNDAYNTIVFQANKYLNPSYKYLTHNLQTVLAVTPNEVITGWGNTGDFSKVKNLTGVEKVYINEDSAFALLKNHTVTGWTLRSDNIIPNSIYEFPTNIYSGKSLSGIEINAYGYKYINATGFISGIGYLTGIGFGSLLDEEGEITDTYYTGTILYKAENVSGDSYGLIGKKYYSYFGDNVNWFSTQNVLESGLFNSINIPITYDVCSYEWTGLFYSKNGSGNYTFYTNSDDASYVWVGNIAASGFTTGNALVNNGRDHGPIEKSGIINLTGFSYYPIRVQFGNVYGGGLMNFKFASPGGSLTSNGSGFYFNNEIDIDNPNNIFYNYNIPATGFGLVTGINSIDFTFTGSKTIETFLTGNIIGSGYLSSSLPSYPYEEEDASGYYRLYQDFDFKYYLTTGKLKSPRYSEFVYFTGNNKDYIVNDICTGLSVGHNETNFIYSGKGINAKYTGIIYGSGILSPSGKPTISVTGYLSGDMQKNTMIDGLYGRAYTGNFSWQGNLPDYFISQTVIYEYPNKIYNFNRWATILGRDDYRNDFLGYFLPKATENYTFYLLGDDAAAFWIGNNATSGYITGNSLITTKNYGQWFSGSINLTSGVYYPIRIIGSQGGGTDYVMFGAKSNSIYETVNNIKIEKTNLLGYLYSEPIYNTTIKNNFSTDFLNSGNAFIKKVDILCPDLKIKQTFTGNFNANINYLITGLASGNFPNPTILNVSGIYNLKTGLTYFPNDNGVKDFSLSSLDTNFAYVTKIIYPPIYSDSTSGTRGCIALLSNGKVTGINGLSSLYYPYINDTTLSTLSGIRDIFLTESYALYAIPYNGKVTGLGLPTGGATINASFSGFITGFNNIDAKDIIKIVDGNGLNKMALLTGNKITGCGSSIINYNLMSTLPTGLKDIGLQSDFGYIILNNNQATGWPFYSSSSFVTNYQLTAINSFNNAGKVKTSSTKSLFLVNPNKRLIGIGASAQPAEALFTGNYIGLTGKRYNGYYGDDPYWFDAAVATVNTGYNFLTSPVPFVAGSSVLESYQFTGWFKPGRNEDYTFYTNTDDASHLWLGEVALSGYNTGNALVNNGGGHGSIEKSGTINLTGSYYYPIRIQYGNGAGGGAFSFYYSGKSMTGKVSIGAYPPIGHTGASGNYFFRELDSFVKSTWNNRFILTGIKDFEINNFYAMAILNDNSITGWTWGNTYPDLDNIVASGKTINNISGLAITNYQAYALLDDGKLKILNSNYNSDSIIPTNIYNQTFYAQDTSLKPLFPVSTFSKAIPNLLITGTGFFEVNYTGDLSGYDLNTNFLNDMYNRYGSYDARYQVARNQLSTGVWKSTGNMKVFENLIFTSNNSGLININSIKTGSGINNQVLDSTGKFYDIGLSTKRYFQYFNDDLDVIYPPKINQTILSNNENYYQGFIWSFNPDSDNLYPPKANTYIYKFKSAQINRLGSIFNSNEFAPFGDYIIVYEKGKIKLDNGDDPSIQYFTRYYNTTGNYFTYANGYNNSNYDASEYAIPQESLILIYSNRLPSDPTGKWNINPATNTIIYKEPPLDYSYLGDDSFAALGEANFYGDSYNNFTLEWTGYFKPKQSGDHTFYIDSDDAGYMWLGDSAISGFSTGNALVKNSGVHFSTRASGTINLTGGFYYPLRIIYGSKNDGQNMYLTYKINNQLFNDGFFRDTKSINIPYQNYSGYVTNVLGTGNYYNAGLVNDIYKAIRLTGKLFDANGYLPVLGNLTGTTYDYVPNYEANINRVITGKLLNPFSVKDNEFLSGNNTFYGSGYLNTKISRTGFFSVSDFANVSGRIKSKFNFIFTGTISSGVSVTINNSSGAIDLNNLNIKQNDFYYANYFYNDSNYNIFVKNASNIINTTLSGTGYFINQASGLVYGFNDVIESGRWYVTGNLSGTTKLLYNEIDSGVKYFNQNITGALINPTILNQNGIIKTTISGTGALNTTINGSGLMIDNISGTPIGIIFSNSFVTGLTLSSGNFSQTITGNAVNGIITYNQYVSGLINGIIYSKFIDNIIATGKISVSTGNYVASDNLTFNYIKTFLNTFNIQTGYYISGQPSTPVNFNFKKYYKVTSSGTNFTEGHYTGDAFIDKNINSIYLQVDYLNKYDSYPLTGKISLTGYNIYTNDLYSGIIFITGNTTGNI